jgi:hypothetical protein
MLKEQLLAALDCIIENAQQARAIIERQDDNLQDMQEDPCYEKFDEQFVNIGFWIMTIGKLQTTAGKEYFGNENGDYHPGEVAGRVAVLNPKFK